MNGDVAIIKILLNDNDVSGVVSTRVYPYLADEETTLPYIVVLSDGIEPNGTKSESSKLDVESVTVQVNDLFSGDALTVAGYVRAALDRYKGSITAGAVTVDVTNIFFDNQDKFIEREVSRTIQVIEQSYHLRIRKTPTYTRP